MDKLTLGKPLHILLVSTGVTTKTSIAVESVRERRALNSKEYDAIFDEAEEIVHQAKDALANSDLERVGQLMNYNHELLQKIGVSCEELDYLVDFTRQNGAIGSKMTGGGMGGYMVALFPDAETQEMAAQACEAEGFKLMRARIE